MNQRTVQYGAASMGALITVMTIISFVSGVHSLSIIGVLGVALLIYGCVSYHIVSVYLDYSSSTTGLHKSG